MTLKYGKDWGDKEKIDIWFYNGLIHIGINNRDKGSAINITTATAVMKYETIKGEQKLIEIIIPG